LSELEQEEVKRHQNTQDDSEAIFVKNTALVKQVDPIPDVEWWDEFILPEGDSKYEGRIFEERITNYV
jgi:hypothetical protein